MMTLSDIIEHTFLVIGAFGLLVLVFIITLPVFMWCMGTVGMFFGKWLKPWWNWWLPPNFWP